MAEFYLIGNKWFDGHVRHCHSFNQELDSAACHASPLTSKDAEDIRKCMICIANISKRIAKRINKTKK